jgi:hypothetical protein
MMPARDRWLTALLAVGFAVPFSSATSASERTPTVVTISGESFLIDGSLTYSGMNYHGVSVEGLLLNSRMVQGIFDDENPETRVLWQYPDADDYDAERNTREFVAAMPQWREHGLLAFTVCLQGGGPIYGKPFPYDEYLNSAYQPDGHLKPAYMARLEAICDQAAELKMAVILSLAYFGMDHRHLEDPGAVRRMADEVVDWLADHDYRHVLIEIANESTRIRARSGQVDVRELIPRVRERSREKYRDGFRLLCATSGGGGWLPPDDLIELMDFVLVHGNGQSPADHVRMIKELRSREVFRSSPKPIVFNEAHTDIRCLRVCAENHASWGYFDQGTNNYRDGYQTPPVRWDTNTEKKRAFFDLVKAIATGAEPDPVAFELKAVGFEGLPAEGPVAGRMEVRLVLEHGALVDQVEFFVDEERVNVERQEPYYLGGDTGGRPHGYDVGQLQPGEHTLRAVAHSLAGETVEQQVTFTVAAEG